MAAAENDRVKITHPDVEGVGGPVTRAAFETLWEPKGWRIVDDETTPPAKPSRRSRLAKTEEA